MLKFPSQGWGHDRCKDWKTFISSGEEKLKSNLSQAMSFSTLEDACSLMNILKNMLMEDMTFLNPQGTLRGLFG